MHKDGELVKFHDHLTQGGVACAMSHHKALKLVTEQPEITWALILEDPTVHFELKVTILLTFRLF